MTKYQMKELIKSHGIDELINSKQRKFIYAYYSILNNVRKDSVVFKHYNNLMPSNLKHGGNRNTCYDITAKMTTKQRWG